MLAPLTLALLLSAPQGHAAIPTGSARLEHFVLEEHGEEGPSPVGVLAFRRIVTQTGVLLEQEVVFRESGLRILVDEQHDLSTGVGSPQFVWRELRSSPATGRTWLAEWDPLLRVVSTANHGTRAPVHGMLPGARPVFPLSLVELLRAGTPLVEVETLDPLGQSRVELEVVHGVARQHRTVELLRGDGSLAGRYVFDGERLIEVQLQAGHRVARPCERAEFERLSARWYVRYEPLEGLRALARGSRAQPR